MALSTSERRYGHVLDFTEVDQFNVEFLMLSPRHPNELETRKNSIAPNNNQDTRPTKDTRGKYYILLGKFDDRFLPNDLDLFVPESIPPPYSFTESPTSANVPDALPWSESPPEDIIPPPIEFMDPLLSEVRDPTQAEPNESPTLVSSKAFSYHGPETGKLDQCSIAKNKFQAAEVYPPPASFADYLPTKAIASDVCFTSSTTRRLTPHDQDDDVFLPSVVRPTNAIPPPLLFSDFSSPKPLFSSTKVKSPPKAYVNPPLDAVIPPPYGFVDSSRLQVVPPPPQFTDIPVNEVESIQRFSSMNISRKSNNSKLKTKITKKNWPFFAF